MKYCSHIRCVSFRHTLSSFHMSLHYVVLNHKCGYPVKACNNIVTGLTPFHWLSLVSLALHSWTPVSLSLKGVHSLSNLSILLVNKITSSSACVNQCLFFCEYCLKRYKWCRYVNKFGFILPSQEREGKDFGSRALSLKPSQRGEQA